MSSYNELIKNFERVRAYIRDFYLYGFKGREAFGKKSARTYDDERRRIEGLLGDHVGAVRSSAGKTVYLSIDSRSVRRNPIYKAWKAKSFTRGDITLHFILLDILSDPRESCSLAELLRRIDEEYLSAFDAPMVFDESTVRKKLKEYAKAGVVVEQKAGRTMRYRRAEGCDVRDGADAIAFFSEVAPCGVLGSFLLDGAGQMPETFCFKHHYLMSALDSEVLSTLFSAMHQKRMVTALNTPRGRAAERTIRVVPLCVFASVQNGRQHLLAATEGGAIRSYRIDFLSEVKLGAVAPSFDAHRARLTDLRERMWGVNVAFTPKGKPKAERVTFDIRIGEDEPYILDRLMRERRVGRVERVDAQTYRFTAEVCDTGEMIPWIRSFIGRITAMTLSKRTAEERFKNDLRAMYRMYGIGEEGEDV